MVEQYTTSRATKQRPWTKSGGVRYGLAAAPSPDGPGRIPALAGPNAKVGEWSVVDIAEYLRSGFTPEYDSAGGAMVDVIENAAKLSDEDRMAIATYLKTL